MRGAVIGAKQAWSGRAGRWIAIPLAMGLACTITIPGEAGRLEPFLQRLATVGALNPTGDASSRTAWEREGSPPFRSPIFAWDAEEAGRGRARVLVLRAPGASWDAIRNGLAAERPSLVWEGEAGDIAQIVTAYADLAAVAARSDLLYVMRPPAPVLLEEPSPAPRAAEIVSEGLDSMRVSVLHRIGITGNESKIGILDLGFLGYEELLGTELPLGTRVRSFFNSPAGLGDITGGGVEHGTACAEIIHDIAPGAVLYLANVQTLVDLKAAVDWFAGEHVSVISHSVGWYFGGLNGEGPINDIADGAVRKEILWVNAAGNEGQRHTWMPALDLNENGILEFDNAMDETLDLTDVTVGEVFEFVLLWDEWPTSRDLDLALEFVSPDGNVPPPTAPSDNPSDRGGLFAFRDVEWTSPDGGPIRIRVRLIQGDPSGKTLHIFRLKHEDGQVLGEHRKAEQSLLIPADSRSVVAVGAVSWADEELQAYSSRGSIHAGPEYGKPELVAPVDVTTRTYGRGRFGGTSAAAPHVAGAAGLLASAGIRAGLYDLQWTRDEIRILLQRSAKPDPGIQPLAWGVVRVPVPDRDAARAGMVRILGNPAFGRARWGNGCSEAAILDVTGRIIARGTEWGWSGRDAAGRRVPPGIYWIQCPGEDRGVRFVWTGR